MVIATVMALVIALMMAKRLGLRRRLRKARCGLCVPSGVEPEEPIDLEVKRRVSLGMSNS